jgi:uncharacterized damage-inducible protein DinB
VNLADLETLVDFNFWARDRLLDAAAKLAAEEYRRDLGSSFKSIRDTCVHIYSAEWVWYSRWEGRSPTQPLAFDDYPDVATLRAAWIDHEAKTRALVSATGIGEAGVTRVIEYRLMNGQPGKSAFWQMLQHVVNHGTYHRGQVTTMMRQIGAAPPKSTDLIAFYRERA